MTTGVDTAQYAILDGSMSVRVQSLSNPNCVIQYWVWFEVICKPYHQEPDFSWVFYEMVQELQHQNG